MRHFPRRPRQLLRDGSEIRPPPEESRHQSVPGPCRLSRLRGRSRQSLSRSPSETTMNFELCALLCTGGESWLRKEETCVTGFPGAINPISGKGLAFLGYAKTGRGSV